MNCWTYLHTPAIQVSVSACRESIGWHKDTRIVLVQVRGTLHLVGSGSFYIIMLGYRVADGSDALEYKE